jgi:hypothetical protein
MTRHRRLAPEAEGPPPLVDDRCFGATWQLRGGAGRRSDATRIGRRAPGGSTPTHVSPHARRREMSSLPAARTRVTWGALGDRDWPAGPSAGAGGHPDPRRARCELAGAGTGDPDRGRRDCVSYAVVRLGRRMRVRFHATASLPPERPRTKLAPARQRFSPFVPRRAVRGPAPRSRKARVCGPFARSGRQDLNLRRPGPQPERSRRLGRDLPA